MKKQNIGFAFLLLGLIFAVPADSMLWWIGAQNPPEEPQIKEEWILLLNKIK